MCGGVRFEVGEQPLSAVWCHCKRCQRRTGTAASISARLAPGSLRILQGEELLKAWTPPDGFAKVFCSECGSQLWAQSPSDPDMIFVRASALDDPNLFSPQMVVWAARAPAWDAVAGGIPAFATSPQSI